ncbi:hypothetical protein ABZY36_07295 [Streptomyces sp. NPDC006627]|uniref:hypothetical protein n=1 Tax=Streptomyces sp. NPDC006627 TaxID=3154679 RepID=UPI0033A1C7BE
MAEVEETGLHTDAQRSAYVRTLYTTSYTAAGPGQRDQALAVMPACTRSASAGH